MKENIQLPKKIVDGYASQFDIEPIEYTDDLVHIRWNVGQSDLNPANIAHGGAIFSVADTVCALLGFKTLHVLTKSVHFYYYRPVTSGEADVRGYFSRQGSFTSLMEVEIRQNGKLCMKGFYDMAKMKGGEEWQHTGE
ncbi:MAG: PaaI family thioesterase [Peptoniphilus sp.]|nr:PaaI family thioesterase [Peptoniphilus sp.]MDD7363518.1 PaaI family thioesterase [Bacillota bacterium]MDY6044779.1 PaaI family thioesterase [Peptoniphilus sp.]